MLFLIGAGVVIFCVFGSYMASGGHMAILFQPFEFLIIGGAAVGGFIIGNPKAVISATLKSLKKLLKGSAYTKASYLELLSLIYAVCKLVKSKGVLAIEAHVENPHDSTLFQQFPTFHHDHHMVAFLCDYLRLWTLGTDNPNELETLMDEEIETHHHEHMAVADAVQSMADAMPALGIVAAVLGVIHTMGSITEPPEVLGHLIGAALVGTFAGILMSYGFIAPMASSLKATFNAESKYLFCIKAGLLAHMNGCAPAVTVEFARKTLTSDVRPTFYEVEEAVAQLPAAA